MIDEIHDYAIKNQYTLKNGFSILKNKGEDKNAWKFFAEFVSIRHAADTRKRMLNKDEVKKFADKLLDTFKYLAKEMEDA